MKLEDIKKKNIYSVPDNYFDQLPGKIQERVTTTPRSAFRFTLSSGLALKLAGSAMAIMLLVFYFWAPTSDSHMTPEDMLAQVNTSDLIVYLETTDMTTDELLNEIDLNNIDLEFNTENALIEDIDDQHLDELIDALDLDYETL